MEIPGQVDHARTAPLANPARTAVIVHAGGRLSLPLGSPYESQILADHLRAMARRHRSVELRIGAHRWSVRGALTEARCGSCAVTLGDTAFDANDGAQCDHCATGGLLGSRDRRRCDAA
jgi:hypothetical protein